MLDTLTDAVLTACARAPPELRRRLVQVVDRGIARPRRRNIPQVGSGGICFLACQHVRVV